MTDPQPREFVWPDEGYSRIPYGVYTDAGVYQEEQQKIFRGPVWNFVGLEQEIPGIGDFRTIYIGETPVIVVRDDTGEVRVMVNRCAHRGNLVCVGTEGHVKELTCVYHNWRYDLQGKLINVAFGKGVDGKGGMPEDFEQGNFGLQNLKTYSYAGLIFASFSDDPVAFETFLGHEMLENMERVVGRDM